MATRMGMLTLKTWTRQNDNMLPPLCCHLLVRKEECFMLLSTEIFQHSPQHAVPLRKNSASINLLANKMSAVLCCPDQGNKREKSMTVYKYDRSERIWLHSLQVKSNVKVLAAKERQTDRQIAGQHTSWQRSTYIKLLIWVKTVDKIMQTKYQQSGIKSKISNGYGQVDKAGFFGGFLFSYN